MGWLSETHSILRLRYFRFFYCTFLALFLPERALTFIFHGNANLFGGLLFVPDLHSSQLNLLASLVSVALMSASLFALALGIRPKLSGVAAVVFF